MSEQETTDTGHFAEQARAVLNVDGMVAACQELVRIPSLSRQEQAVAQALSAQLEGLGYDRVEVDKNGNVLAWMMGTGDGPTVMFNGHIDHVPPQAMDNPYSGQVVDATRWGESGEAIYGRGTCDMKCNVVAGAFAGAAIKAAGIPLAGTFIFTADVQEEIDSPDGILSVITGGVRADYGLSAESTGLNVYLGHRGKVEFELTVHGRTSHSSNPSAGDSAVVRMAKLIIAIEHHDDFPSHPVLGEASIAITDIRASPGGGVSVVPDRCTIRVDRRFVPGETPQSCREELERIVERLHEEDAAFICDIEQVNLYPMLWIHPEHSLVKAAQAARQAVMGEAGELGGWLFGVNGTFMAQEGIPTVGFGPGDERWAHTSQEHILVSEIETAAQVYIQLIIDLCGVRQKYSASETKESHTSD